ncbi:MAG TPA: type II toxin-antitoxin system Phd/YefM family antitoxin [bacterium]|nr:type II toxin-antitoxin system Phd/YefM family antitoxin [bacterium]
MKASIVDLRYKMKDVLKALNAREPVSIYYHGKLKGTIVSPGALRKFDSKKHPFFGMRQGEKKSVERTVKELRKTRYHAL